MRALRFTTGRDDVLDPGGWVVLSFLGVAVGLVWLATAALSAFLPNLLVAALVLVVDAALVSPAGVGAPAELVRGRNGDTGAGGGVVIGLLLAVRVTALLAVVAPLQRPFLLLAVPVLGRLGGVVFAAAMPPTSPGLARPSGSAVVAATGLAAVVCVAVARAAGLAVGTVSFAVALALGGLWRERRLPGDACAVRAAIVLAETGALIALNVVVEVGAG